MITVILFLITLASSVYAAYCDFKYRVFKNGFVTLAKITYNPRTEEECREIVEKLRYESTRYQDTDNK